MLLQNLHLITDFTYILTGELG